MTRDFATAKLAMQIKAEEKLITFDKFFSLGSFYLEMAFSFLGKIIEQSVGSHILDECKILAKGPINSKSYKRFRRMRELLALAFEIVHFEAYLTTKNCEETMGTNLQGKKGFRTRQVPIIAYQHQRI